MFVALSPEIELLGPPYDGWFNTRNSHFENLGSGSFLVQSVRVGITRRASEEAYGDEIFIKSRRYANNATRTKERQTTSRRGHSCGLELDRLGRSVKHLVDLVGELQQERVHFKSLTDSIDTGTASGRFFFHVMASLAEMERELIVECTRAGLKLARQLGRTGGRKRLMSDTKVKAAKKLLAGGVPARDVASNLGVFIPTPYRWVPASTQS